MLIMPVTLEHIEKVYFQFRKAQSEFKERGFTIPKNFEKHFNRMSDQNRNKLIKITGWFLTKWSNIDKYTYFKCGFELYKNNFSYMKFFEEKILLLYIRRDKNRKREVEITKTGLIQSAKFVKKWISTNNVVSNLYEYMSYRDGNQRIAIEHYIKNKIDASFFVFLLRKGMLLTDTERSCIPYIQINYRKIVDELSEISDFVRKMESKL